MSIGLLALLFAAAAAGWLLLRVGRDNAGSRSRNVTILKAVIWFGLAAALFAAKLWPLAFMVLLAAGGVMAIESWREGRIEEQRGNGVEPQPLTQRAMSVDEAFAVLGVAASASVDDVRTAHKKLIAQIHPDKGGTDYLASKINEARDILLNDITPPNDA